MPVPFIMINLDKPRRLRCGMGASCAFEQLTGIKITDLQEDSISIDVLSKLLWVMLQQDEPGMTFEQCTALVDEHADNMLDVLNKAAEALRVAYDTGEASPNAKAPARKR